jgi:putative acyl-CoA dehydrogenase
MTMLDPLPAQDTHEVVNQVPPLVGHDTADDAALLEGLQREGAGWYAEELHRLGRLAGSEQAQQWGEQANRFEPELRTHDRTGHRVDEVEFHPAWHSLLDVAVSAGLAGSPWADDRPGAHVARAAGFFAWGQVEAGHGCPVSMTYAVVPALRSQPDLAAQYEPLLTSRTYDPGLRTPSGKAGLLAGMGMTEKQGGSDVRANRTTATDAGRRHLAAARPQVVHQRADVRRLPRAGPGARRVELLPGAEGAARRHPQRLPHPAAQGQARQPQQRQQRAGVRRHRRLARGRAGARRPHDHRDGGDDAARLRHRLLGRDARRRRAGRAPRRHRSAFGGLLVDKPLMRNVLADLQVESEAATALTMRLAGAVDRGVRGDAQEKAFARLAVAVGKYWVCKRQPSMVAEALECLGGNGYVEESPMPRLYREAPLNSIWEGLGQRAGARRPARAGARARRRSRPSSPRWTRRAAPTRGWTTPCSASGRSGGPRRRRGRARRTVERMALVLQGSLLVRHAPPRWPTPSAPPGWPATAAWRSARCPAASTPPASSPASDGLRNATTAARHRVR